MTSTTATQWSELARRGGNGVEVALLWNRSLNRVKVAVIDERLCHHLDFEVAGAEALNAFTRPFAEAASHLLAPDLQDDLTARISGGNPTEKGLDT